MTIAEVHPQYFRIKKDAIKPYLQFQVFNPDGTPRNLNGASLLFFMRNDGSGLKVNGVACVAVNAAIGVYEFRWLAAHTNEAGLFRGEVEINNEEKYPVEGYITIEILPDLE